MGHYAIRSLMFQASQQAGISPLRLGFTGTLKVIRRAGGDFQPTFRTSKCSTKRLRIFLELAIAVPGFGDRILPY